MHDNAETPAARCGADNLLEPDFRTAGNAFHADRERVGPGGHRAGPPPVELLWQRLLACQLPGRRQQKFTAGDTAPGDYTLRFSETSGHLLVTGSFRVLVAPTMTNKNWDGYVVNYGQKYTSVIANWTSRSIRQLRELCTAVLRRSGSGSGALTRTFSRSEPPSAMA